MPGASTFTILSPARWERAPTGPIRLRQYWLARGLQCLYLYCWPFYYRNWVDHSIGGADVGTGPVAFGPNYLQTSDTPTASFSAQLGFDCQLGPVTFLSRELFVSGANGVAWSAFDPLVVNRTGYLGLTIRGGSANGTIVINNGDAAGQAVIQGQFRRPPDGYTMEVSAFDAGIPILRGAFGALTTADTTSVPTPGTGPITVATMGMQRTSIDANHTAIRMQLFGAANQAWELGELRAVSLAPYGELFERDPKRVYMTFTPPPPPPFLWYGQTLVSGSGQDVMIPSGMGT